MNACFMYISFMHALMNVYNSIAMQYPTISIVMLLSK